MITEATTKDKTRPFDAIVVHSQSRFFRSMVDFALYERRLNKAGLKVISITQPTGEEISGEMMRRMISLFDEYQSKENSKHTLRAMKENARRGFFNGSMPPFGYKLEEVEAAGNKGKKKRLALDEPEGSVVRKIFDFYLNGHNGQALGMLGVARLLNRTGLTFRGKPWSKGKIDSILRDRSYIGEHYFNKKNTKTGKVKPKEKWVLCAVPQIIDESLFNEAQLRREAQHPSQIAPRLLSSPIFLAGVLRCARCGSRMTLATGKGGRYRYYKCNRQIRKGHGCDGRNVPMGKLDVLVRQALAERVFTPERVRKMVELLRANLKNSHIGSSEQTKRLRQELEKNRLASERLLEAVEKGLLPMDDILAKRSHALQSERSVAANEN
jgi:site-specific DNA recombinase